jgi:hypothetical protein
MFNITAKMPYMIKTYCPTVILKIKCNDRAIPLNYY